MSKETIIYENEHYVVMETDDALGEDGNYGRQGYALVNRENGFVEGTNMMRANIIFLADQANGMLVQLTEAESDEADEQTIIEFMEDPAPIEH